MKSSLPTGPRRPACALLALAAATCLLTAGPAAAEKADRDKPIYLEADQASVDDAKQTSVFTGHVVLTQGTLVIRGDKMVVKQDPDGFRYGTAYGNPAYFRQKRDGVDEYVEGWAQRMEYNGKEDTVHLFDKARMVRGRDEVEGNYISYNSDTEIFKVLGGGKSAGGRVKAVIQPKSQTGTAPAAPKPPAGDEASKR